MNGTETALLSALGNIVMGGLFYTKRVGKFFFKKKGMELGLEAPKTPDAPAVQSGQVTTQNIHYGLDKEGIKEELEARFEEQNQKLEDIKKLFSTGATIDQKVIAEKSALEQELAGMQAKLANMEKALEDRNAILAETEKALENEKLRSTASEEELAEARQKVEEGDASALEELFSQYMEEKQSRDEPWAEVAYVLGKLAQDRIDYQTAESYYHQAIQLAPGNALYLTGAGILADILAEYDQAIIYYEKSLASYLEVLGSEHPNVATIWINLGQTWEKKGEYDKAINYYEQALASYLKTLDPEHSFVAVAWNNLGSAWDDKGDYGKAIDYFEKALKSDLKTFGLEHPTVPVRWNNLGLVWRNKGEYDKAIGYYEKSLASDLKTFGPGHPSVVIRWNNLGEVLSKKGDYDQAIEYHEKALASDLNTFGSGHPSVARDWNNLGLAWGRKKEYNKALGYYEKALQVVEQAGLPHRVQLLKKNIAELKKLMGQ